MAFEPAENVLVLTGLNLDRPIEFVVIMPDEARHADANAVLRPADDAVAALRVVLEAEDVKSCPTVL